MGERRGAYRVLVENSEGRRPLERPWCRRGIILKWTGSIRLRKGQAVECCKCGSESSGSIKCGEFLDWLRAC
jgi:hypothetical protein